MAQASSKCSARTFIDDFIVSGDWLAGVNSFSISVIAASCWVLSMLPPSYMLLWASVGLLFSIVSFLYLKHGVMPHRLSGGRLCFKYKEEPTK